MSTGVGPTGGVGDNPKRFVHTTARGPHGRVTTMKAVLFSAPSKRVGGGPLRQSRGWFCRKRLGKTFASSRPPTARPWARYEGPPRSVVVDPHKSVDCLRRLGWGPPPGGGPSQRDRPDGEGPDPDTYERTDLRHGHGCLRACSFPVRVRLARPEPFRPESRTSRPSGPTRTPHRFPFPSRFIRPSGAPAGPDRRGR